MQHPCITLLLFSASALHLAAQPSTQLTDFVEVASTAVKSVDSHVLIEIVLKNVSSETITALSYTAEGRYADGGSFSQGPASVDWVNALIGPETANLSFHPGALRTVEAMLPPGPKGEAPKVNVKVLMVILANRMAYGSAEEIRQALLIRRDIASKLKGELEAVDQALAASAPKDALQAAVKVRRAKGQPDGGITVQVQGMLERNAKPEDIRAMVSMFRQYQATMENHSTLKGVE